MQRFATSLLDCSESDILIPSSSQFFSNFGQDKHWYGNSTLDICRVMLQYSPFKPTPQQYEKWMTIFHPVVYDLILVFVKLVSVLYLIIHIRHQYRAIQISDQQEEQRRLENDDPHYQYQTNHSIIAFDQSKPQDSVLIFPLYLRILIGLAFLCLYQAIIDIIFPLNPSSKVRNPLVNSLVHAAGIGGEHMFIEGVSILLIFQGVGKRTTVRTLLISLFWGLICAVVSFWLNFQSLSRIIIFSIGIGWACSILLFYTCLWLLPLTCFHRRPAVLPFARIFTLFHSINAVGQTLIYFKIAVGHCLLHLTHHGILGVCLPYLIYTMLVDDSKYWQGLSVEDDLDDYTTNSTQNDGNGGDLHSQRTDDSIQGALMGITFDPSHARHIAKQMDGTSSRVNLISFAAIRLEKNRSGNGPRHVILGAGSSARVYRGIYHNRRVAIKTILCLELTQDVITSFYREASLLSSLRHENVVAVEGMCVNPPALCLVMELCGGSLMDLLSAIFNNSHTAATNQPKQTNGGNNGSNTSSGANRQSTRPGGNNPNNKQNNNKNNDRNNVNGSGNGNDNDGDNIPYFSYYADQNSSNMTKLRRKKPLIRNQYHLPNGIGGLDINTGPGSLQSSSSILFGGSNLNLQSSPTSAAGSSFSNPLSSLAATILGTVTPSSFGSSISNSNINPGQNGPGGGSGQNLTGSRSMASVMSIIPTNVPLLLTPQNIPEYYDMESVYQHPLDFWKDLLRTDDPSTQEFSRNSASISISQQPSSFPNISGNRMANGGNGGGTGGGGMLSKDDVPIPVSLTPNDTILSWLSRVELMIQCCTAVDFLHQQSPPILHLDIKSSNFLLGFDGRIKLADLELSRHIAMTKDGDITAIPTISSSVGGSLSSPTVSGGIGASNSTGPGGIISSTSNDLTSPANNTQQSSLSRSPSGNNANLARSPSGNGGNTLSQSISSSSLTGLLEVKLPGTGGNLSSKTLTSTDSTTQNPGLTRSPSSSTPNPGLARSPSSSHPPSSPSLLPSNTSQLLHTNSISGGFQFNQSYHGPGTVAPSTAFLIDLLSDIITNGPSQALAHDMAHQSRFNGITIPERVNWLAPELMLGHKYNEKVDVYALGCVLYEIVTGKVPFFDLELQLKQLVTLPRGVSVYYHRSTTNSQLMATNTAQHYQGQYGNNQQQQQQLIHQQPLGLGNFSQPRSSTFINPRQQQNQSLLASNHILSDSDGTSSTSNSNNNKKQGGNERNSSRSGNGGGYNTFFETSKQPPITTTPTTEQIQTAIKVMVAIHHYRPIIPIDTPKIIRDLIEQAWHPNPAMRPTCHHMAQVLLQVKFDLLNDGGLHHIY